MGVGTTSGKARPSQAGPATKTSQGPRISRTGRCVRRRQGLVPVVSNVSGTNRCLWLSACLRNEEPQPHRTGQHSKANPAPADRRRRRAVGRIGMGMFVLWGGEGGEGGFDRAELWCVVVGGCDDAGAVLRVRSSGMLVGGSGMSMRGVSGEVPLRGKLCARVGRVKFESGRG
jgi:hypothetical protein